MFWAKTSTFTSVFPWDYKNTIKYHTARKPNMIDRRGRERGRGKKRRGEGGREGRGRERGGGGGGDRESERQKENKETSEQGSRERT